MEFDPNERKYLAVSIKHSVYDKPRFGTYTLWGSKRTADDEPRCFGGYTGDMEKAELYSLKDFRDHYGAPWIKDDEPVIPCFDMLKKYKKYDTVLVDAEVFKQFMGFN